MTRIVHDVSARPVTVGIDTHKDVHVAVALDSLGVRLGQLNFPTTADGYRQLEGWACSLGPVAGFGIEGTGSYGAALARALTVRGHHVVEVNRPDRATRRRAGKSDPVDAEAAARAVLANIARVVPKSGDRQVEMIRMLKMAKDSAIKARTQAMNQIKAILVTASPQLRDPHRSLTPGRLIKACATLDTGPLSDPDAAARYTLQLLANRHQCLSQEIRLLRRQISSLLQQAAPNLLECFAVAEDAAATLLITAGDNPHRLHSEAAFAALCGTSPIQASSGKIQRHRLNRGGDRRANATLFRIVIVRLRYHQPTRDYMTRRLAQGKTKLEIIRCLKRFVARELYQALLHGPATHTSTA
ncbi:MAG TPA: IS110 family transposase [Mycobacterium sp.]|nr:IS110 family transposase [Mycobacterium sp.]